MRLGKADTGHIRCRCRGRARQSANRGTTQQRNRTVRYRNTTRSRALRRNNFTSQCRAALLSRLGSAGEKVRGLARVEAGCTTDEAADGGTGSEGIQQAGDTLGAVHVHIGVHANAKRFLERFGRALKDSACASADAHVRGNRTGSATTGTRLGSFEADAFEQPERSKIFRDSLGSSVRDTTKGSQPTAGIAPFNALTVQVSDTRGIVLQASGKSRAADLSLSSTASSNNSKSSSSANQGKGCLWARAGDFK